MKKSFTRPLLCLSPFPVSALLLVVNFFVLTSASSVIAGTQDETTLTAVLNSLSCQLKEDKLVLRQNSSDAGQTRDQILLNVTYGSKGQKAQHYCSTLLDFARRNVPHMIKNSQERLHCSSEEVSALTQNSLGLSTYRPLIRSQVYFRIDHRGYANSQGLESTFTLEDGYLANSVCTSTTAALNQLL